MDKFPDCGQRAKCDFGIKTTERCSVSGFSDGGRRHETKNVCDDKKLERARTQMTLEPPERNTALLTP